MNLNLNSIREKVQTVLANFKSDTGPKTQGTDQPLMTRKEMLIELGIDPQHYFDYIIAKKSLSVEVAKKTENSGSSNTNKTFNALSYVPAVMNSFVTRLVENFKSSKNSNRNKYKYRSVDIHKASAIKSINDGKFVEAAKFCMFADYVTNTSKTETEDDTVLP